MEKPKKFDHLDKVLQLYKGITNYSRDYQVGFMEGSNSAYCNWEKYIKENYVRKDSLSAAMIYNILSDCKLNINQIDQHLLAADISTRLKEG